MLRAFRLVGRFGRVDGLTPCGWPGAAPDVGGSWPRFCSSRARWAWARSQCRPGRRPRESCVHFAECVVQVAHRGGVAQASEDVTSSPGQVTVVEEDAQHVRVSVYTSGGESRRCPVQGPSAGFCLAGLSQEFGLGSVQPCSQQGQTPLLVDRLSDAACCAPEPRRRSPRPTHAMVAVPSRSLAAWPCRNEDMGASIAGTVAGTSSGLVGEESIPELRRSFDLGQEGRVFEARPVAG